MNKKLLTALSLGTALFLASCGQKSEQQMKTSLVETQAVQKDVTKQDCALITSDKKSFNQKNLFLYDRILASAIEQNRIELKNVEGGCTDFFDYLYSYANKLDSENIFPKIFSNTPFDFDLDIAKKKTIAISFAELTSSESFKFDEPNDELIINSKYRFHDDGGKDFLEIIRLLHSKQMIETADGSVNEFSINFINPLETFSDMKDIFLAVKKSAEVFTSYPGMFFTPQAFGKPIQITLNLRSDSSDSYIACYNFNCHIILAVEDALDGAKTNCAAKYIQNAEATLLAGRDYFNLTKNCR